MPYSSCMSTPLIVRYSQKGRATATCSKWSGNSKNIQLVTATIAKTGTDQPNPE